MNERIKQLEEKLEEIKAELAELKKQGQREGWVPKFGEEYYIPEPADNLFYGNNQWDGTDFDVMMLQRKLAYRTAEEAAEAGKRMYYKHWFHSLSDVSEEDWKNDKKLKWCACYDYQNKEIFCVEYHSVRFSNFYFSSKEKLRAAIDEIGEDNFLKYVLGVT